MTPDISRPGIAVAILLAGLVGTSQAAPINLKSGVIEDPAPPAIDGAVNVGLDGYGGFGASGRGDTGLANLRETPEAGSAQFQSTAEDSFIAIRFGDASGAQLTGNAQLIGSGSTGANGTTFTGPSGSPSIPSGTDTRQVSSFSGLDFGAGFQKDLDFELIQTIELYTGTNTEKQTVLHQQYLITNNTGAEVKGELLRYADFDLNFLGSFATNGAGFRAATATQPQYLAITRDQFSPAPQIYTAITAEVYNVNPDGSQGTRQDDPTTDRYAAGVAETVKDMVLAHAGGINNLGLSNFMSGSTPPTGGPTNVNNTSPDQLDFAVAFRNAFTVAAGGQIVYTTQTLWGEQSVGAFTPPDAPDLPPTGGTAPIPGTLPLLGIAIWSLMGMRRRRAIS